jgi:hypothetical protein
MGKRVHRGGGLELILKHQQIPNVSLNLTKRADRHVTSLNFGKGLQL